MKFMEPMNNIAPEKPIPFTSTVARFLLKKDFFETKGNSFETKGFPAKLYKISME